MQSSIQDPDSFGNTTATIESGCVAGCAQVDEVITHTGVSKLLSDASGWSWRPAQSWVSGSSSPATERDHQYFAYDALGRVTSIAAQLVGSLPLARSTTVSGGQIAPAPPSASIDGTITVRTSTYDAFGNVTASTVAGASCTSTTYDPTFAQLPVVATAYAGTASTGGCGTTQLVTSAQYDRGLGVIVARTGVNGEAGQSRLRPVRARDRRIRARPGERRRAVGRAERDLPVLRHDEPHDPTLVARPRRQPGGRHRRRDPGARLSWPAYVDGLRGRNLARVEQADPTAGDAGSWLVTDFVDFDAKGSVLHTYRPWFWSGNVQALPLASAPTTAERRLRDAFGRVTDAYAIDGSWSEHHVYHAQSSDSWDAGHLGSTPGNSYVTTTKDGHRRTVSTLQRFAASAGLDSRTVQLSYLPTGEPTVVTRTHGTGSDAPVVRWMQYDTLGRMVLNVEPDTTVGFNPSPAASTASMQTLRYAYDNAGHLVGTSDARGCGENLFYDSAGRLVAEDYSPCAPGQPAYSAPNLTTGDGTETFYLYDSADPAQSAVTTAGCAASDGLRGRLASVSSRGAKDVFEYDGRGRIECGARRLATPGVPATALASRYAARWYVRASTYDGADRAVTSTTGAQSPQFLVGGKSAVSFTYAASGAPATISSSYGPLLTSLVHDAEGAPLTMAYGDVADTTSQFTYDTRHRLSTVYTGRSAPAIWSTPPTGYSPPTTPATTQQLELENAELSYDGANNPTEIQDLRGAAEWPAGAKPVSRAIGYDDLLSGRERQVRLCRRDRSWTSPYEAEDVGATSVEANAKPAPHVALADRILSESFAYDWKGDSVSGDDDEHAFYDRSLGAVTNGAASAGPYQLASASNRAVSGVSTRAGDLAAQYDAAGELTGLVLHRDGGCLPQTSSCWQRFAYEWDEIGHVIDARRWDLVGSERTTYAPRSRSRRPPRTPDIELAYAYDQSGYRTLKVATGPSGAQDDTAYVFSSLELQRTTFSGDYVLNPSVETPYLAGLGRNLGRVVYATTSLPTATSGQVHLFLDLPDYLGSSAIEIDSGTSELVERGTYSAFGAEESDYRPDRWGDFPRGEALHGEEDDIEVGLLYFGARYYAPALGRWISPDPLALHSPGAEDDNLYAYGHGRAFAGTDPDGRVFPLLVIGIAILVAACVAAGVNAAVQGVQINAGRQKEWDWGSFWIATAAGGAAGATAGIGTVALGGAAAVGEGARPARLEDLGGGDNLGHLLARRRDDRTRAVRAERDQRNGARDRHRHRHPHFFARANCEQRLQGGCARGERGPLEGHR